jgi:chitin synthase
MFIFATWWWPRYYYVYLPFISITVFLNAVMVCSVIIFSIKHRTFPQEKTVPEQLETLVFIVPCYNETPEELTRSLDSLAHQTNIGQHPRAIMIICDGKVRGPGMERSSADYLLDDILVDRRYRRYVKEAYSGWTHECLDVEVQVGSYRGIPYYCIVKQQNQGKRDSLIALRSFLYNFNIRAEHPEVVFSTEFFSEMASFLTMDGGMQYVTYLVGMDGDTVFDDTCVSELLKEARYPNVVGVCGYVAVDFTRGRFGLWSPWNLYQSAEYTISQGLRRFHQSIVTNKVSCLPGCCQLLRICETTCGNRILFDLFGYCPKPTDSMLKHIRATASEDRNHVCLMLSAFPKAETRQALRARAYTDVPHSWSVFLSQRRRWTLGATSNDLYLVTAPGIYWFERILAFANCLVWFVSIFVFASIACLVVAILSKSALFWAVIFLRS